MRRPVSLTAAVFLSILLLSSLPGLAIEHRYIEDFTTTQYKDTLNTTAWWDTVAGELRLYPFVTTIVGTLDTPGDARGVAVSGDHAFVADGSSGLQVIDISDPTDPTLAGSYNTPGDARGVAVSGDHAFVADSYSGLQVIDISDPANPTLAGTCDTPGYAYGVAVSGDHAFVADGYSGLQVIDISDPTDPTLAGSCGTQGQAYAVVVSGDHAFVADWDSGLLVIDISDPTNPALAGSYDTPGRAYGIEVSGDHAFVVDEYSGLLVIDISDPTNPALAGNYDTPGYAYGVAVSGDHAFVADYYYGGLQVINISDPTNPVLAGSCDTQGEAVGVAVSGDHVFMVDLNSGLQVIEISAPTDPTIVGDCDTPGDARGVAVSGDHAFVADNYSGLQVIDISDPSAPTLAGTCDTPGQVNGVAVSGDHAFVADYDAGFLVIDISDPTNPTIVGTCDTPGYAGGVAVSGDHAFVADYASGLQVIDISDPTNPVLAGTCDTPGQANGVAVSGDYAFVVDEYSGLQVIDISDPTDPTLAGSYDTPGRAFGVVVSGDHAFVADNYSGLQVIDISDPANPMLAGGYDPPGGASGVAISGDHAFVTAYTFGLQVIDISDPTDPTLVGTCDTPGGARGVAVSGDHAFVADWSSGLQVIQVFQSEFDRGKNTGRSLIVDVSNDTLVQARLTATQVDSVEWELSADGGVNWQRIVPGETWTRMAASGSDLLWRSTHSWAEPGVNPGVSHLEIDWLVEAALIESIVDVPNDQGRSVSLSFLRSGHDFLDETVFPVVGYAIYRRLDDPLLVQQVMNQPAVPANEVLDHPQLASFGPDHVRMLADRTFIVDSDKAAIAALPPGIWEGVGWILPAQSDSYTLRVNTLADSTANGTGWTVFVAVVHTSTPSIWFVSEPDSGYSVDNIAPGVPLGLAVAYNTGSGNDLSWDPSPEPDFQYYRIYRGDSETFVPGPENLVHETAAPAWTDPEYDGWDVHYKVTALDLVGNESAAAGASITTGDDTPHAPDAFALYQNVPNPFNPATTIRFDLPRATHVNLSIFNVKGELVSTVADRQMSEGSKEFVWRGVDSRGLAVSSGMYFYRLVAGEFVQTRKMVLLR